VKQMRWHKEGKCDSEESNIMSHHVDGEAWQTPDYFDPEFAWDPKSVCLALSPDGFDPHNTDSSPYSCWPVFVMPYNLPLEKCLKQGFTFLALVILGPKVPKKQINIFLRPLMEELKKLWQGVHAYDSHMKCCFNLCAAYLCSIQDYLAYDKFASWCVHGQLYCPICMDDTDAFMLEHNKKVVTEPPSNRGVCLSRSYQGILGETRIDKHIT
jgi:hypothetical protein